MAIEIEKKFLVPSLPPELPQPLEICQGYISDRAQGVVRVRTMGEKGFITIKGKTRNASRLEYEYQIPLEDASQMLRETCLRPLVEKNRYTLIYKGFEWVIDVFKGENNGLMVAEIELEDPDQSFEKPPWAGDEVTHDPRYFNSNLIAHPFSTW